MRVGSAAFLPKLATLDQTLQTCHAPVRAANNHPSQGLVTPAEPCRAQRQIRCRVLFLSESACHSATCPRESVPSESALPEYEAEANQTDVAMAFDNP